MPLLSPDFTHWNPNSALGMQVLPSEVDIQQVVGPRKQPHSVTWSSRSRAAGVFTALADEQTDEGGHWHLILQLLPPPGLL